MSRFINTGYEYINVDDIKRFRITDNGDTVITCSTGKEYTIYGDKTKDIIGDGQATISVLEEIRDSIDCLKNSVDGVNELIDSCIVQDRNGDFLHIGGIVAKL